MRRNKEEKQDATDIEEIRLINQQNKSVPFDEVLNLKNSIEDILADTDKEKNIKWTVLAMIDELLENCQ